MMEDRDIQRVKVEAPVTRLEVRVEDKRITNEEGKTKEIETASDGQTSPHTVIMLTGWATEITERGVDPGIEGGTWSTRVTCDRWRRGTCLFHGSKAINPVAAVLILLPLNWDARIVKMVDSENGVISVQHKEAGADMSGDLRLVVTNIFDIFNIEVIVQDSSRVINTK